MDDGLLTVRDSGLVRGTELHRAAAPVQTGLGDVRMVRECWLRKHFKLVVPSGACASLWEARSRTAKLMKAVL